MSPQTRAQQEEAEAKKRSEAAKKAAATRKKNEDEAAKKIENESEGGVAKKVENKPSDQKPEEGAIPSKFSQETRAETRAPSPSEFAAQEHEMRVEHNKRTGGGDVRKDELQAQRDEHNRRTAGIGV